MSALENDLAVLMKVHGLPEPLREFKFAFPRRYRFDFFFLNQNLAVEVEGATWTGGRHTRGAGFEADCKKYNLAALKGIKVLRFTASMIRSGEAIRTIKEVMGIC